MSLSHMIFPRTLEKFTMYSAPCSSYKHMYDPYVTIHITLYARCIELI